MRYIFQRIIKNDFQWVRPSPGRLGRSGEGAYVQKYGYGHEDWNFNEQLAIAGYIYGYTYYQPSELRKEEKYSIAFATYVSGRWYIIGFYKDATWVPQAPYSKVALSRKANDLQQLGDSLGGEYKRLSRVQLAAELKGGLGILNWKVRAQDAIRSAAPVEIPRKLYVPTNYRIVKPTVIDRKTYDGLFRLLHKQPDISQIPEVEVDFPEGRILELKHKVRERNATVVRLAKNAFLSKHKRLYCQVCGFDFQKAYGVIGNDFIEAHHTRPVSSLRGSATTNVQEIALVCSNCHRMLHRRRPWLELNNLKALVVR